MIFLYSNIGRSKCPHEENTAAIEDPELTITKYAPQNVFPDEDMVFGLLMKNKGVGNQSSFVLSAQQRDNEEGVQVRLDGAAFTEGRQFTLKKDIPYKKLLTVQRGPLSYQFPGIDLALFSSCGADKRYVDWMYPYVGLCY